VWQSENNFVGVNNDFTEQAFYSSYLWNMKIVFAIHFHLHSVWLISSDFVVEHVVGGMSGLFGTFETNTHYFEIRSQASCAQGPVDLMLDLDLHISQVKVISI
jgi:hypothetical protein